MNPPRGRLARAATAAAALVAVAILAWLLRQAPSEESAEDDPVADAPWSAVDVPVGSGSEAPVAAVGKGTAPERAAPGAESALRVRVLDAESSEPVASATVLAIADSPAARGAEVAIDSDVLFRGATDASGRCVFEWAEAARAGRIVADAPGHRCSEFAFATRPHREIVVRLERGIEVRGIVLDSTGRGIPNVEVAAAHAGLARGAGTAAPVGVPGRDAESAVTDAQGRFVLTGLAPGTQRLEVKADGWALDQSVPRSEHRMPSAIEWVFSEGDGRDARIVMIPVRVFSMRLLRGASNAPVASTLLTVEVSAAGHGAPTLLSTYGERALSIADEAPRGEPSDGLSSGAVSGHLLLDASHPIPSTAAARIEAFGFRAREAQVTLRLPSEAAGGAPADVVRLEPEEDGEVGVVVADCSRGEMAVWRPATRILTACRKSDGRVAYSRGVRIEGERWEFSGVPVGDAEVRVFDGVSHSEYASARVRPGVTAHVTLRFPAPSGVVFALRDAEGRRLYDADAAMILAPGQDRGAPHLSDLTRLRLGPNGPLDVVHALPPGEYRYAIVKRGFGQASGTFLVPASRVTRIEATLEFPPRTTRADRGAGGR